MQILSGRAARVSLRTPPGRHTRPTLTRVREAIFSSLEARRGPLIGLRVLDAFAGSGALGLEAWSRGAERVVLVDAHGPTCRVLVDNIRAVGASRRACTMLRGRMPGALTALPADALPLDLVFLDPPYGDPALADTLRALVADPALLAPDALLVVEQAAREPALALPGLHTLRAGRYADTVIRLMSPGDAPDAPSSDPLRPH